MAVSNRLKNQHLLWRAGFGPMAENAAALDSTSQKDLWKLLEKTSAKKPAKIEVAQNLVDGLYKGIKDVAKMENPEARKEQQKRKREQSRDDLKNLNILWLEEMINSEAQLREKMSLFWHGHFACRVINSSITSRAKFSLGFFFLFCWLFKNCNIDGLLLTAIKRSLKLPKAFSLIICKSSC